MRKRSETPPRALVSPRTSAVRAVCRACNPSLQPTTIMAQSSTRHIRETEETIKQNWRIKPLLGLIPSRSLWACCIKYIRPLFLNVEQCFVFKWLGHFDIVYCRLPFENREDKLLLAFDDFVLYLDDIIVLGSKLYCDEGKVRSLEIGLWYSMPFPL